MSSINSVPGSTSPRAAQIASTSRSPSVSFPPTAGEVRSSNLVDEITLASTSSSYTTMITPPSSISRATYDTSPSSTKSVEKKRMSVLSSFSRSSRRSVSVASNVLESQPEPVRNTSETHEPTKALSKKPKRTLSMSSPFQRFKSLGQPTKPNGLPSSAPEARVPSLSQAPSQDSESSHFSKASIGKGIRSVARTVKNSLHQLDRPLSLHNDRKHEHGRLDHLKQPQPTVPVLLTSEQSADRLAQEAEQSRPKVSGPGNAPLDNASVTTLRTRALSESASAQSTPARSRSRKTSVHHTKQSLKPSSTFEPGHRPISTFGSLPQAASLLARPPPDPTTFLAIIPGQPNNLSLVPPSSHDNLLGEPNLSASTSRFAGSVQAQPALSSRPSDSDLGQDSGFTFIRSPDPGSTDTDPEFDSGDQKSLVEREPSYDDTGSGHRVPSDLEDFTGADWSQLIDHSTPNLGTRHRPIIASDHSLSTPVSEFELDTSATPLSEPGPHPGKVRSEPEFRMLDIPCLPNSPLLGSESGISPWTAPANWETSQNSINAGFNDTLPHESGARSTRRKTKLSRVRSLGSRRSRTTRVLKYQSPPKSSRLLSAPATIQETRHTSYQLATRSKVIAPKSLSAHKRRKLVDALGRAEHHQPGWAFGAGEVASGVLVLVAAAAVIVGFVSKPSWSWFRR